MSEADPGGRKRLAQDFANRARMSTPAGLALADQRDAVLEELRALTIPLLEKVGDGDRVVKRRDRIIEQHRQAMSTWDSSAIENVFIPIPADLGNFRKPTDLELESVAAWEAPRIILSWMVQYEFVAMGYATLLSALGSIHVAQEAECGWHVGRSRSLADQYERLVLPLTRGEWLVLVNVCGSCVMRVRQRYGDDSLMWIQPDELAPKWSFHRPRV